MKTTSVPYRLVTIGLRIALIVALVGAGWFIYSRLPYSPKTQTATTEGKTTLQIVLRGSDINTEALDINVEIYPIDIVAARHEYFTERRAGKRFDDFLSERMKGRTPVTIRLDKQGQTSVGLYPGNWWLHALLAGEEELEWRLPITVTGNKQTIELTSENVYTRARSF
ncbi:MAG TPA: hypothetical protein VJU84_14720 [Pyrinomonadaceae bacterium]|nr:hypothetical protein [Pyrinomonadaceae bacterium]